MLAEFDDLVLVATRAAQIAHAVRLLDVEPAARSAPEDARPLDAEADGILRRSLTARVAAWRAELPLLRRRLAAARAGFASHRNLRRALHLIDCWRDVAAALTAESAAVALIGHFAAPSPVVSPTARHE